MSYWLVQIKCLLRPCIYTELWNICVFLLEDTQKILSKIKY